MIRQNINLRNLSAIIIYFFFFIFSTSSESLEKTVNFDQVDLMIDFLTDASNGNISNDKIDKILRSEGTELIIKQMNIVRRVNKEQYQQLLVNLLDNECPEIEPIDNSERAKRGVDGLKNNVWIFLKWAINNLDTLKSNISSLRNIDVYDQSKALAMKYLPKKVEINPSLFVVMGGRPGAAALDDEKIYYDILHMSFSRIRKNTELYASEAIDLFAHEIHHLGMDILLKDKFTNLKIDENQEIALGILKSLVYEGSATFLINGKSSLESLNNRSISRYLKDQTALFKKVNELLKSALNGDFVDKDLYEKSNTLMFGEGYHAAGASILNVIYKVFGLNAVMEVISDPRLLLDKYNEAAIKFYEDESFLFLFDSEITIKLKTML